MPGLPTDRTRQLHHGEPHFSTRALQHHHCVPKSFLFCNQWDKNALAVKCPQHCTTHGPAAALTCQVSTAGRCFNLRTDLVLAFKVGKGVPRCCSCCPLAEMLKQTAFSSTESCLSQHRCRYKQTEDGWCFQSPSVDLSFPVWFSDCIDQALPVPSYHYSTNLEAT